MSQNRNTSAAANVLIQTTLAMAAEGVPLMRRVLLPDTPQHLWDHYPAGDAIAPNGSRYFYHSHSPEQRLSGEQGHFHLFLPRSALSASANCLIVPIAANKPSIDTVHVLAVSCNADGIPFALFTTNRWVTDDWFYKADAIIEALGLFDVTQAPGDRLVGRWLTAMVVLARPLIARLLHERDEALLARDPGGENRSVEILSQAPLDLQNLLE